MIHVRLNGRQFVPPCVDIGLSLDVNAETVRFTVPQPRAAAFGEEGVAYAVYWFAPNKQTGRDALALAADDEGNLVGDWIPPEAALLFSGPLRAEIQCEVDGALLWHSEALTLRVLKSLEDEGLSAAPEPKYKQVTLTVHALPEGSEPAGRVSQDKDSIDFELGIPTMKGDPGEAATLEIRDTVTGASGTTASFIELPESTPQKRVYRVVVPRGDPGEAATLAIVQVHTELPGTQAKVEEAPDSTAQARRYILTVPEGEKGEKGNVLYAVFDIDAEGDLWMYTDEAYDGPSFALDEDGYLEVIVNA